MSESLERDFSLWADDLQDRFGEKGLKKAAREAAKIVRRNQMRRIKAQQNPDGTPYIPRLRRRGGKIRVRTGGIKKRLMFARMATAKHFKIRNTPEGVELGFWGRVGYLARVHQYGYTSDVSKNGPRHTYHIRELLGWTQTDIDAVEQSLMNSLNQ